MNRTRKTLSLLCALVCVTVCVIFSASAYDYSLEGKCGKKATYSFNTATGEITVSGKGKTENYDSYLNSPFYSEKEIRSITVKKGITKIGNNIFSFCTAKSISLPDTVASIGKNAFMNSSIKSITIPENVKFINSQAFKGCKDLKTVKLNKSLKIIKNQAFAGCTSLKEIIIPASVRTIERGAFVFCKNMDSITVLNPDCIIKANAIPAGATIYANADSTAYKYAEKYGNGFASIGNSTAEEETTVLMPTEPTTTSPIVKNEAKEKKPARVKIKTVKSKKRKSITLRWKPVKRANGYEILASTSKKFTNKTTKIRSVRNSKNIKATVRKLKTGKKYFVKLRAYKLIGDKKLYGVYSTVKSVKVK